ncbi:hypothetical protein KL86CLO1_10564 [uncultured Eubacteriales bacterium]|uniref:Uncharacterized protein n=1 Tax=uncultured Eubacteriales bacterium TaxID=172733 RepID=A0A212J5U5_9FIRM|nr:hypothetical protein KL86CLO1_10564 [uncultured Eubacteriales bacterium]
MLKSYLLHVGMAELADALDLGGVTLVNCFTLLAEQRILGILLEGSLDSAEDNREGSFTLQSILGSIKQKSNRGLRCSYALVAKLVYAIDLGSILARGRGSSPLERTKD